jgi:membrane-associated phospholipid phosphatase
MWRRQIARSLSIVGHPLVVSPGATWIALASRTSGARVVPLALALFALLAVCIAVYSWTQVRSGRWTHVDASASRERRSLNSFLLAVLSVCAAALWLQPHARAIALGLTLSCCVIGAAMLAAGRLMISLHVAFVVFASIILWQVSVTVVAGALVFTAAVGWARLELGRHTLAEVVAGAALGFAAGGAFWFVLPHIWR